MVIANMVGKIKTIMLNEELDTKLDEVITQINESRITGNVSKSKLIRVALGDYLAKMDKIKEIEDEYTDAHKTAADMIKENGF